jgi:hypothetical protein
MSPPRARNGFVAVWRAAAEGEARWIVRGADVGAIAFVPSSPGACALREVDARLAESVEPWLAAGVRPPPAGFGGPDDLLDQLRRREHAGALALCEPTLHLDDGGRVVGVSARILRAGLGAGYERRGDGAFEHRPAVPSDGTRVEVTFGDDEARIDHWQRFAMLSPVDWLGRFGDGRAAAVGWLRVVYRLEASGRSTAWCASSYLPSASFYREWVRTWRNDALAARPGDVARVLEPQRDVPTGTHWTVIDASSGCLHASERSAEHASPAPSSARPPTPASAPSPWARAVLDHFRRDAVVSLERLKPPTHLAVRAVHAGVGDAAVLAYELIDAPPPPSPVAWGGSFEASLLDRPGRDDLVWFLFEPGIPIELQIDRLRHHVRAQLELVSRRGSAPLCAEEPADAPPSRDRARGSQPAASQPAPAARFVPPPAHKRPSIPPPPPEPPPPPPLDTTALAPQPGFDPRKRITPVPARAPTTSPMAPLPPPPPIPFGLGDRTSGLPPPPEPPPPPPALHGSPLVPSSQRPLPPVPPAPRRASQPPPPDPDA